MTDMQRPPAELRHADELELLKQRDGKQKRPVAPGWQLSVQSVVEFVLNDGKEITGKYVGRRSLIERCVVSLTTDRGLMPIGEPGTAKFLLSELLAAAISGDTTSTIQDSTATTEDAIKYSWNYTMLLAEGPTLKSLVPAPVHRGMSEGKVVRFEEITRCVPEVQDSMLSALSGRTLSIPELDATHRTLHAKRGLNVIGTANTHGRGVSEISVALRRRLSFKTIGAIENLEAEMTLVERETGAMLRAAEIPTHLGRDAIEVLVKVFRELRPEKASGQGAEHPSSAMSTAEAVSTDMVAAVHAAWFGNDTPGGRELAEAIVASALKDEPEDVSKLRAYHEQHTRKCSGIWQELYKHLP